MVSVFTHVARIVNLGYLWFAGDYLRAICAGMILACSRLSVVGDERKHGQEKKMREDYGEAGREGREPVRISLTNLFHRP